MIVVRTNARAPVPASQRARAVVSPTALPAVLAAVPHPDPVRARSGPAVNGVRRERSAASGASVLMQVSAVRALNVGQKGPAALNVAPAAPRGGPRVVASRPHLADAAPTAPPAVSCAAMTAAMIAAMSGVMTGVMSGANAPRAVALSRLMFPPARRSVSMPLPRMI